MAQPTETIEPSAIAEPSATLSPIATATIEPTATPTVEVVVTVEPSATVTIIRDPTATATVEPTVTVAPDATATPTDAPRFSQTACAELQVEQPQIVKAATGEEIVLRIHSSQPWRMEKLALQFYQWTDDRRQIIITQLDSRIVARMPVVAVEGRFSVSLEASLPFTETGALIHIPYNTAEPAFGIKDSFRLQYTINGSICAESRPFVEAQDAPIDPPTGFSFVRPDTDDVPVTSMNDTRFEVTLDDISEVNRIEFAVLDDAGGLYWRWSEYTPSYCAFSTNGTCKTAPISWWQALGSGRYTLRATLVMGSGQRSVIERRFIKLNN